jgi:hypothetical protein
MQVRLDESENHGHYRWAGYIFSFDFQSKGFESQEPFVIGAAPNAGLRKRNSARQGTERNFYSWQK